MVARVVRTARRVTRCRDGRERVLLGGEQLVDGRRAEVAERDGDGGDGRGGVAGELGAAPADDADLSGDPDPELQEPGGHAQRHDVVEADHRRGHAECDLAAPRPGFPTRSRAGWAPVTSI